MTAGALLISGEIAHMTAAAAGMLLIMFLPFLVSLAGQPGTPKMLCLVTSLLALLLSLEPYGAVMPWLIGMIIAVMAVRERLRRCRAV